MVLADTSVWIDYFNGVSNWQAERLDLLLDTEPVALGDLILTEVLQGFREDADFRKAQTFLAELQFYELGGYEVCLQAARNYRALRAKGMTVRKTVQLNHCPCLHRMEFRTPEYDRDFDALQQILGLQVVPEG